MATQRIKRDMIRWERLSEEQQVQLDRLFAGCPGHQDTLREIKRNDGDAMPLILLAKELWDEVAAIRQQGVQAFRDGFALAQGFTLTGEPRDRDNEDPARAYLFVWFDRMQAHPVPILKVEESHYAPYPQSMVVFKVIERPLKSPNVKEVDETARRFVAKSVATGSDDYRRKRSYRKGNRRSEKLVEDLMEHFDAERRLIQERLNDAVFSLEREFPDLVYRS